MCTWNCERWGWFDVEINEENKNKTKCINDSETNKKDEIQMEKISNKLVDFWFNEWRSTERKNIKIIRKNKGKTKISQKKS